MHLQRRTRVGIELTDVACRLVEVEEAAAGELGRTTTRVRSYAILPRRGADTDATLTALGRRPVAVVVWGASSDHRQVVVSSGPYERMRAEAVAAARAAGVETSGTLADIARPSAPAPRGSRQPVLLALADAQAISAAVQPLVDAGVRVQSVTTPAAALLAVARSRQALAPGGIEAYVALDEAATCVALVRDGALVAARELGWGYKARHDATGGKRAGAADDAFSLAPQVFEAPVEEPEVDPRREELAGALAEALTELVALADAPEALSQVAICGGLGTLRTMTAPLMERLDIEVETLDSLFGIDAERLPEPADPFHERAAELRIAWAAAAERLGSVDLLRPRRRRRARVVALARAAVVAGVTAGVGAGWAIEKTDWWRRSTAPAPVTRRATEGTAEPATAPAAAPSRTGSIPMTAASTRQGPQEPAPPAPTVTPAPPRPTTLAPAPPRPTTVAPAPIRPTTVTPVPPASTSVALTPPPTAPGRSALPAPAQVAAAPPPSVAKIPVQPAGAPLQSPASTRPPIPAAPSLRAQGTAPVAPPAPVASAARVPPPVATERTQPQAKPAVPSRSTAATSQVPPAAATSHAPRTRSSLQKSAPSQTATPFDAVLGTVLYSPERKLAIVDGVIVGIGDRVHGARVVDITPTSVLLNDAEGRPRSLTVSIAVEQRPAR